MSVCFQNGDTCTVRALDLDGDKTVEHPIIPGFRSARGKDKGMFYND